MFCKMKGNIARGEDGGNKSQFVKLSWEFSERTLENNEKSNNCLSCRDDESRSSGIDSATIFILFKMLSFIVYAESCVTQL